MSAFVQICLHFGHLHRTARVPICCAARQIQSQSFEGLPRMITREKRVLRPSVFGGHIICGRAADARSEPVSHKKHVNTPTTQEPRVRCIIVSVQPMWSCFQPMTNGKESGRGKKGEASHEFTLDVLEKREQAKQRDAEDSGKGNGDTRPALCKIADRVLW